jgi:hypothetical protein
LWQQVAVCCGAVAASAWKETTVLESFTMPNASEVYPLRGSQVKVSLEEFLSTLIKVTYQLPIHMWDGGRGATEWEAHVCRSLSLSIVYDFSSKGVIEVMWWSVARVLWVVSTLASMVPVLCICQARFTWDL